jgi:hydroxymethylpyrimidine pyrophosphatase-like HAD family hydrolase
MTRMARRLRAALSLAVAAAIVVLSPGLEAPRLFAQVVGRAVPVQGVSVVAGASAVSSPSSLPAFAPAALTAAPALSAPSAFASAPAAAAPSAAAAASLPEFAAALAPHLDALAKPGVTASGAASAGRGIEDALTGQRSAGSGEITSVAAAEGSAGSAAAPLAAASAPAEAPKPGVPAAAVPVAPKTVRSESSYRVHRFLLRTVAALTGAVFSQPVAGPALTAKLIKQAAERRAVFSDYDDTLAAYNQVLPADMVSAVQAVKDSGKDFVVISDRGDEPRAHQLTVFESLASLPVETRAGMYVAANSGGRVYRYDEAGTPVRVFEAPALDEASKAKVAEAAEAAKARLKEIGAEQHFPSAANNNPSESWGTYGYALMLKVGSSNEQVRGAADILQAELAKRGLDVEVNPRFAKDPANPPYINFSIVTKETSSAYIAKALKLQAKDIVVIGDSMYAPHEAKQASWLTRLGAKVAGRALPQTGNRTDANMEKAIPGALTLSVGATGDPRPTNLWVLGGKGPSVTREVLMSLASKTRAALDAKKVSSENTAHFVGAAAIIGATAAAYYFLGHALADWVQQAEQQLHQNSREFIQDGALFGGVLGSWNWKRLRAKASSAYESYGTTPGSQVGHGALGFGREFLAEPSESYGEARKKAVEIAAERGVPADQVFFVQATASMPVRDGSHWHYAFSVPGKNGGRALIYADASRFLGGALEIRTNVYENAPLQGGEPKALEPVYFHMGTRAVSPEQALDAARRAQPGMSAGVGVSLEYRTEPVSGDADLWYRFFDDKGAIVSVNARTAEARVEAALPSKDSLKASVSRQSPIDGFSSFVYAEALTAARAHAVELGYAPDNLRVTGARLSPRAWGEDWTFSFVAPREGYLKEPRAFELSVRRTMVSETLVDAYGVKDLGPRRFFVGFRAADLPGFVKIDPMDVIRKSGDAARSLELQARWTGAEQNPELWYVVRGDKGRELSAINAKTGVVDETGRWESLKKAAITIAMIAATAGIYAVIWWAMSHAPAAASSAPEGWQGPIPDIGALFGGTVGLAALTGTRRGVKKAKVPNDETAAAAKSVNP